jgi:hypothetical protein
MSNVFGFPITAPSITLTDPAGLVTDLVTADEVATPLVRPDAPVAGSGVAGEALQVAAADGASSASTAGGRGGDLELFAGDAGTGTAAADGGSVILQPGSGHAPGVSGIVRADGTLVTSGALVNLGAGTTVNLTAADLRAGLLYGTPTGPATYNLPSASSIVQGFPGIKAGDIIRFSVVNLSTVTPPAATISLSGAALAIGAISVNIGFQAGAFALIATNVSAGAEAFTLYRIAS